MEARYSLTPPLILTHWCQGRLIKRNLVGEYQWTCGKPRFLFGKPKNLFFVVTTRKCKVGMFLFSDWFMIYLSLSLSLKRVYCVKTDKSYW
jgi:hypothetical protein